MVSLTRYWCYVFKISRLTPQKKTRTKKPRGACWNDVKTSLETNHQAHYDPLTHVATMQKSWSPTVFIFHLWIVKLQLQKVRCRRRWFLFSLLRPVSSCFPAPCDWTSVTMPSRQICVIYIEIQIWMRIENEESNVKTSLEINHQAHFDPVTRVVTVRKSQYPTVFIFHSWIVKPSIAECSPQVALISLLSISSLHDFLPPANRCRPRCRAGKFV